MTNTLHRYGKAESFFDDYIVFSLPAKSKAAGQTGDAADEGAHHVMSRHGPEPLLQAHEP